MHRLFVVVLALVTVVAATPLSSLDWRIIGGSNAEDGQFPFQTSIQVLGNHICGGSVINTKTILTAAYCVTGISSYLLNVVVGTNTLNAGGKSYKVASTKYHKNYNPFTLENDVAVVILAEEIELNEKVQPIELNTEDIGSGVDLMLSGWGTTSYPRNTNNDLQFIKLKSLSNEECQSNLLIPILPSQICALTKVGEGACHGDSGSGLISGGTVYGLVSRGRPCAVGYPDVFTGVYNYVGWIMANSA